MRNTVKVKHGNWFQKVLSTRAVVGTANVSKKTSQEKELSVVHACPCFLFQLCQDIPSLQEENDAFAMHETFCFENETGTLVFCETIL